MKNLPETIKKAWAADAAFEAAIRAEGFKSRWDWNHHVTPGSEALRAAYRDKIAADNAMHADFVKSREAAKEVA